MVVPYPPYWARSHWLAVFLCLVATASADTQDRSGKPWTRQIVDLRLPAFGGKNQPDHTRANDPFAAHTMTPAPPGAAAPTPASFTTPPITYPSPSGPQSFGLLPAAVNPIPSAVTETSIPYAPVGTPYSHVAIPAAQPTTSVTPVDQFPLEQDIWGPTAAAPSPPPIPKPELASSAPFHPAVTPGGPERIPTTAAAPTHEAVTATIAPPIPHVPVPAPSTASPKPKADPDDLARVLAVVGDQPILFGDLVGPINLMLAELEGRAHPDEIEHHRQQLIRHHLPEAIITKLAMLDVQRSIPAENIASVEDKIREVFYEKKVPDLKTGLKADSIAELDQTLRNLGSSLSKQERTFFENVVASEALNHKVQVDKNVPHEELLAEYRSRQEEYYHPPRVRWERLMVRFDAFPSRAAAMEAIVHMGNRVVHGESFGDVAREASQCPNAQLNGQFEWTRQGSLASQPIEEALFSMPVGRLSRVIEDNEGYHILRVHERDAAGYTPFADVQKELTVQVQQRRLEKARDDYIEKLKREIYVWVDEEFMLPTQ